MILFLRFGTDQQNFIRLSTYTKMRIHLKMFYQPKKLFLWFLFPLILSFKETTIFYDFLKQVRWLPWYLFRRGVSVLGSHGVLKLLFVRTKRSFLFRWIIHSLSLFKLEVRKKNLLKKNKLNLRYLIWKNAIMRSSSFDLNFQKKFYF